jgi:hypothetical protein
MVDAGLAGDVPYYPVLRRIVDLIWICTTWIILLGIAFALALGTVLFVRSATCHTLIHSITQFGNFMIQAALKSVY